MRVRNVDPDGPTLLLRNIPVFLGALCGIFMAKGFPLTGILAFVAGAFAQNWIYFRTETL